MKRAFPMSCASFPAGPSLELSWHSPSPSTTSGLSFPRTAIIPASVPLALRFYLDLSWGALAALYVLMMGYISNDAPRRGMSTRLWMVCILIPGGIGAVLYFLLRQPITASCPSCGAHIEGNYHYCPQCAYQVAACCSNCYRSARITDIFCVHCGHDLTANHPPGRLHAFTR